MRIVEIAAKTGLPGAVNKGWDAGYKQRDAAACTGGWTKVDGIKRRCEVAVNGTEWQG